MWHFTVQRFDGTAFNRTHGLYSVAVAMRISMLSTFYYEEPLRVSYATCKKKPASAEASHTSPA